MPPDQTTLGAGIYHFDVVDYLVFFSMLALSALTGLYYGCRSKYCNSKRGQTVKEYLTGNKSMRPIPVSLSLMGSYLTGSAILGTPSEIYHFGTQYWLIILSIWLSGPVVAYVYLPVYLKLQVNSSYEYLELRFNRTVRTIASLFFILSKLMFLPIIIYGPSLAFNQVTGINTHLIGSIVCLVCVFYTLLGGFKAVVWTDSWQVIIMICSMLVVLILGTIAVGGPSKVIDLTSKGARFNFLNFNPSMYEKYTVFSVVVGGFLHWTANNSVNQVMVQKYMSLPNDKESKLSVLLFTIGVSFFVWLCCYAGILIYATYHGCDPLSISRIKSDDQIFALFVMETVGHFKGVPGLFIAGIFSAALSTLSVMMNTTAQIVFEDFIKGCMRITLSEKTAMLVVKSVVLILGFVSLGLMFVVEHMGGILTLTVSLLAITVGTTFGVFTLGMLIPWSNSYGAISGGVAGIIMSALVSLGGHFATASKLMVPRKMSVFINDICLSKYGIDKNFSIPMQTFPDESSVFPAFRLSFLWITTVGLSTVMTVGIIVSILTRKTNLRQLDPDLISPLVQWTLPAEAQRYAGTAIRKARRREVEETGKMLRKTRTLPISNMEARDLSAEVLENM